MASTRNLFGFIKSTIFSGIFFLIPLSIILYGIGKIRTYMFEIATVIHPQERVETWVGLLLVNLFALFTFICIAFLVGLAVQLSIFQRIRHTLGDLIGKLFPPYEFIKAYAEDLAAVDKKSSSFTPVLVDLGSMSRLGFQVDAFADGTVAIYLPGTPNPWSGNICYVEASKCQPLQISLHNALDYCRTPGNHHTPLAKLLRKMKS